ncbi:MULTISPECIES: hypothetical protein [Moorena]|uniref:Uncharacterized protein n=1 Tax=Moorena producens 3L TaxID=489825 RepID=F4XVR2_9CYAN|nr:MULTISPECIES: hypothetical protein [Moorena]NES87459.1 hypothetical protein [Moorena sp. SIO2B7]EGJ31325.1 hypothetical protein LYNGBM3L_41690 [Moorena producens 3L]NEP66308.1 hypothetical protein [Moorena sp. SIO3A5]NEQ04719.1 hypothetical protein [Moorena sp. SIO4E2]NER87966.1 hypothetical protein [Moorena sp. SIO3A2]
MGRWGDGEMGTIAYCLLPLASYLLPKTQEFVPHLIENRYIKGNVIT